jgi:hypothetical protein
VPKGNNLKLSDRDCFSNDLPQGIQCCVLFFSSFLPLFGLKREDLKPLTSRFCDLKLMILTRRTKGSFSCDTGRAQITIDAPHWVGIIIKQKKAKTFHRADERTLATRDAQMAFETPACSPVSENFVDELIEFECAPGSVYLLLTLACSKISLPSVEVHLPINNFSESDPFGQDEEVSSASV